MRRALVAFGVLVMAYGVIGLATGPDVDRVGVLVFLAAVLVLHDGVFLPAVLAAGALIGRVVPSAWQSTVRMVGVVGLAVGVVGLLLTAGPLVGTYLWGLLLILVVTAVTAAVGRKGIERSRKGRRG
ncbi:hypothetical protein ACQPZJ_16255 [Actinoplanes sp. CA-054009]